MSQAEEARASGCFSMKRYFYAFDSGRAAQRAFEQLRKRGVRTEDLSIIGRESGIHRRLPDSLSVLIPRSAKGAAIGGLVGLCVSLSALLLLHSDFTIAAVMVLLFTAGAASMGALLATPIDGVAGAREEERRGRALLVVNSTIRNRAILASEFAPDTDTHLVWQCMAASGDPFWIPSASKSALDLSSV
jgi:hypothetical protein